MPRNCIAEDDVDLVLGLAVIVGTGSFVGMRGKQDFLHVGMVPKNSHKTYSVLWVEDGRGRRLLPSPKHRDEETRCQPAYASTNFWGEPSTLHLAWMLTSSPQSSAKVRFNLRCGVLAKQRYMIREILALCKVLRYCKYPRDSDGSTVA